METTGCYFIPLPVVWSIVGELQSFGVDIRACAEEVYCLVRVKARSSLQRCCVDFICFSTSCHIVGT